MNKYKISVKIKLAGVHVSDVLLHIKQHISSDIQCKFSIEYLIEIYILHMGYKFNQEILNCW